MTQRCLSLALTCAAFASGAVPAAEPLFKDPALEAIVRTVVYAKRDTKQPITADDVKNISSIKGTATGVKDLSGLESCTALGSLELSGGEIADLGPLKGLANLQYLAVANNKI